MSKKQPYAIHNFSNGYDLMVERDSGNEIRILTGKETRSREFWEDLKELATNVIEQMDNKVAQAEIVTSW